MGDCHQHVKGAHQPFLVRDTGTPGHGHALGGCVRAGSARGGIGAEQRRKGAYGGITLAIGIDRRGCCSSESGTSGIFRALSRRYMVVANPIWWRLERQAARWENRLAWPRAGKSIAARIPMMAITTSNSMSVNAEGRAKAERVSGSLVQVRLLVMRKIDCQRQREAKSMSRRINAVE